MRFSIQELYQNLKQIFQLLEAYSRDLVSQGKIKIKTEGKTAKSTFKFLSLK